MYYALLLLAAECWCQPGMVANPSRGQLDRENENFPVPVRAWEFGLARRVRPSRPASACSFSTLRRNRVLTHGIPPTFRDGVHMYHQPRSGQSRVYRVTQLRTNNVYCRKRHRYAIAWPDKLVTDPMTVDGIIERCSGKWEECHEWAPDSFQPEYVEWAAGWRGTRRPNPSREAKFSGADGDGKMSFFPVQLTTSTVGNHILYPVDAQSADI